MKKKTGVKTLKAGGSHRVKCTILARHRSSAAKSASLAQLVGMEISPSPVNFQPGDDQVVSGGIGFETVVTLVARRSCYFLAVTVTCLKMVEAVDRR